MIVPKPAGGVRKEEPKVAVVAGKDKKGVRKYETVILLNEHGLIFFLIYIHRFSFSVIFNYNLFTGFQTTKIDLVSIVVSI